MIDCNDFGGGGSVQNLQSVLTVGNVSGAPNPVIPIIFSDGVISNVLSEGGVNLDDGSNTTIVMQSDVIDLADSASNTLSVRAATLLMKDSVRNTGYIKSALGVLKNGVSTQNTFTYEAIADDTTGTVFLRAKDQANDTIDWIFENGNQDFTLNTVINWRSKGGTQDVAYLSDLPAQLTGTAIFAAFTGAVISIPIGVALRPVNASFNPLDPTTNIVVFSGGLGYWLTYSVGFIEINLVTIIVAPVNLRISWTAFT